MGSDVLLCFACPDTGADPLDELHRRAWLHGLIWSGVLTFFWCRQAGLAPGLAAGVVLVLGKPLWILSHEAAHALSAWAVGFTVKSVTIGRGPEVVGWRLGGALWTIRRYPFLGGITMSIPSNGATRWRYGLLYSSGPLANLTTAVVLAAVALAQPHAGGWRDPLILSILVAAVASNVRMGVNALWPTVGVDGQPSDGAQILDLFKASSPLASPVRARLDLMATTQRLQFANRSDEAADLFADQLHAWPNDPYLLGMVIHCTSRAAGDQAAVQRYGALVAEAPHGPPRFFEGHETMVGWLAANIAWSTIKSGLNADLDAADLELQAALERLPDSQEVKATLGALYVTRGEPAIGEALLIAALRILADPLDRADFCRYVAKARRDRGDDAGATDADRLRDHILARAFVSAV
ncbi:MAG TPA: site-2 protease family protein [Caulobacter sp.]|nr:site-2 protease family protein [Caulobacter sp.]